MCGNVFFCAAQKTRNLFFHFLRPLVRECFFLFNNSVCTHVCVCVRVCVCVCVCVRVNVLMEPVRARNCLSVGVSLSHTHRNTDTHEHRHTREQTHTDTNTPTRQLHRHTIPDNHVQQRSMVEKEYLCSQEHTNTYTR